MKLLLTTIMCLVSINSHAAIDHTFNYQGELTDGGVPAGGSTGALYDIAIQAFDADQFGNTVGIVSIHTGVTVTNGLFNIENVNIGSATFDGLDIWLQISVKKPVDSSYIGLTPLQKMQSVPYATTLIDKGATNGQVLTFDNASGWQPVTPDSVFDGAFSSLSGVPAGLTDGDDDSQLSETQVDDFVANNGYVNSVDTTAWDKNAADDFSGDMNNNTIINLADPVVGTDATNKQYVDNSISDLNSAIGAIGGILIIERGIQQNIPVSTITNFGWQECYKGLYSDTNIDLATIISACPKDKLMMACRVTNSPTISLLAADFRSNVLFDVGDGTNAQHDSNYVSWYYSDNQSWGFLPLGDIVNRASCDNGSANADKRLCWHTGSGNLNAGWRCGASTGLFGAGNERLIYQSD